MTSRSIALLASFSLGLAGLVACATDVPLNKDYEPYNSISGTIVADGIPDENLGLAFVLVFDAKNPPPPVGTGRPYTFSAVPMSAFVDDNSPPGVKSASFTIPYLPDTTEETGLAEGYLVTALIDADGNFSPFADALGGSTCGDSLGEYKADLEAVYPEPVHVEGGKIIDDVTIHVNRSQPYQRPAFTIALPPGETELVIHKQMGVESLIDLAGKTQTYRIEAVGVHTTYPNECLRDDKDCSDYDVNLDLDGPCAYDPEVGEGGCDSAAACYCPPEAQPSPCETGFPVQFVDEWDTTDPDNPVPGSDGVLDPYPDALQAANDLKDTWPRMYLEYMGVPEDDEDGNRIFVKDPSYYTDWDEDTQTAQFEWPEGSSQMVDERWVAENYPLAKELNFLPPSAWAPPSVDPFAPFLVRGLEMTFSPAFRHYHSGGTYDVDPAAGPYDLLDLRCYASPDFGDGQYPSGDPNSPHPATCDPTRQVGIDDIPTGGWRMTMITRVGQTWRLPNEIGLPAAATGLGIEAPLESTDDRFRVESQGVYMRIED